MRVATLHGDVPPAARREACRRLRLPREHPDAVDMLLCTEVGGEGLDLEACGTVVNYDLPWDPAVLQQRVGRIDRHGQRAARLLVVNLLTAGTIDAEVLRRLGRRQRRFDDLLGLAPPVLSEVEADVDIAALYAPDLRQRRARLDQQLAVVRRQFDFRQAVHTRRGELSCPLLAAWSALDDD